MSQLPKEAKWASISPRYWIAQLGTSQPRRRPGLEKMAKVEASYTGGYLAGMF